MVRSYFKGLHTASSFQKLLKEHNKSSKAKRATAVRKRRTTKNSYSVTPYGRARERVARSNVGGRPRHGAGRGNNGAGASMQSVVVHNHFGGATETQKSVSAPIGGPIPAPTSFQTGVAAAQRGRLTSAIARAAPEQRTDDTNVDAESPMARPTAPIRAHVRPPRTVVAYDSLTTPEGQGGAPLFSGPNTGHMAFSDIRTSSAAYLDAVRSPTQPQNVGQQPPVRDVAISDNVAQRNAGRVSQVGAMTPLTRSAVSANASGRLAEFLRSEIARVRSENDRLNSGLRRPSVTASRSAVNRLLSPSLSGRRVRFEDDSPSGSDHGTFTTLVQAPGSRVSLTEDPAMGMPVVTPDV